MAIFQRSKNKKKSRRKDGHLNWMGGRSWSLDDPIVKLRVAASSCFFGEPMYYHHDVTDKRPVRARMPGRLSGRELAYLRDILGAIDPQDWRSLGPAELMERAIDEALDNDPEATLREAARLRSEDHIRTTPQVILVRAAHHPRARGTGLVRKFALQIIARADEPAVGLAYQMWRFGKPIPNSLKKAWRDALERCNDYELAKYRLDNRAVKTVDVVNLVHPRSEAVDRLARGQLRNHGRTWESQLSARGASEKSWREAIGVMGHMALLRNLRNLLDHGVEPKHFTGKLVGGAKTGKQLPFRYYSAYKAICNRAPDAVIGAVEQCLMTSVNNLPWFGGRVMSLCDNSGSAQSTTTSSMGTMRVSTIANLTGVLAGMRTDDGHLGVFGDRLEVFRVRRRSSIFDQLDKAELMARDIGVGTENGIWLFWDHAIRTRQHWDTVFVFSDMQAGHGGLYGTDPSAYADFQWGRGGSYIDVARLVATYRARVNPQVNVFLVQVAGYQDTIVPEFYERTFILGGWSDGLLRFAARMSETFDHPPSQVA